MKTNKEYFDIDKSWQVLNYLIIGKKYFSEHPFENLIYPDNYTIIISDKEELIMETFYDNGIQNETEQIRQILSKQELSKVFVSSK